MAADTAMLALVRAGHGNRGYLNEIKLPIRMRRRNMWSNVFCQCNGSLESGTAGFWAVLQHCPLAGTSSWMPADLAFTNCFEPPEVIFHTRASVVDVHEELEPAGGPALAMQPCAALAGLELIKDKNNFYL